MSIAFTKLQLGYGYDSPTFDAYIGENTLIHGDDVVILHNVR